MLNETRFNDLDVLRGPESTLERKLITEFLASKGYQMSDLTTLPEQERHDLMTEACRYATIRLAEIEARSKFRRKIEAPR